MKEGPNFHQEYEAEFADIPIPDRCPVCGKSDPCSCGGDSPPRKLSIRQNHPNYHPCFTRVGVRIDGVERNDIAFYDLDMKSYMTTENTSHLAESIEPYWRFVPSRQHRRAEEAWLRKHRK